MNDNKRLKDHDDFPLVLDVADIRLIMGIFKVSAYVSWFTHPDFRRSEAAG